MSNISNIIREKRRIESVKERIMYTKIYEEYLQSGISYTQLYMLMKYDYDLCFVKSAVISNYNLKKEKTEKDEIKCNKYYNLKTNMQSIRDAALKMHALIIAKKNLDERIKKEEELALKKF